MARSSDAGADAEWRKRFERFRRSGLTAARFCDGEQVSVASFYYWRKKLGQTASRRRTRSRPGVFRQVAVIPAPPAMVPASSRMVIHSPAARGSRWMPSILMRFGLWSAKWHAPVMVFKPVSDHAEHRVHRIALFVQRADGYAQVL